MKKILSVIMVVAMLFTGIVPSVIGTAAADADVAEFVLETAGIVENEETGVGTAELTLSLTNGAGVSGYTVYVYYQNADVTIVDAVYDEDELPVGTTPEFTYVTPGLKSTGRNYKANFTAAGIEPSSAIDFAMVECGYEYELLEEGPVCTLVLETAEMYEDLPEGFSFEVGVIIVEAYDVDDNDVAVCDNFTIAVESAAGDPWAPVYDVESFPEDQFTINVTGTNVYEGTVNDEGTLIAPVNIEFYGNNESNNVKGVWATRVFVYYPQEISLLGFENGRIYEDNNMNVGVLDDNILNPKLTNSAGVPQANAAAIKAFDVCGVDYETLDPNFTGLFFMPDDYRAQVFGDGVLATATFALPADAQVGDEWYVGIANDIADVSDTDNNDVAFVLDNGYIKIIPKLPAYEEETFPADQFTINMQGVTVAEGTEEITLDIEFYGNNADNNVKGVWATRVFVYYPQEIELLGFENGKIYADNNMNVGVLNDNIFDPKLTNSAGVPQANNAAIKAFDVCGVDYTTLDPNFTGLFFMPDDYRAQVFGDGTLATVTFKLPADAKAGTEWYVGIANDIADVSDTDNNDVAFVLDNGYIKIYGADVCDHAETIIEGAIDADCVNPGYTGDKVCAACGELVEAGSEIAALGHTAGGKEIVVEPTYTTEGSYVINCSVCGTELETGIIPVLVQPVVTVGTVEGTIGKEVKVPVTIDNNGGLFIASFTVNYDAVLTYTGFEIGDVFAADNVYVTETADGELVLYFEALDVADVTANGTLVNLVFAIDADASEGDAAVSIVANDDDCINVEGENVAIGTADGAVSMIYPQAIVVESVDVEYEKDAIVPVVITVNPGVWAIRAEINVGGLTVKGFNDGLFALVEGENYSIADGVITVFLEGAALENITDNAALFEIILGLNDAQVGETADIGIKLIEVIDVDGNDLDFLAKGGTITVIPCAHDEVTGTETKAPSVYEEGVISYICNNCGETVATEAIPCLAGIIVSEFISAKAGEQAEVEVNLMNNPGLWSLSATFAFDANVFELAGIKSGSFTADEFSYSVADGVVTVYVESDDLSDVTMEGLAFTLVFNAISCGYSDIDVELVAENTINAAGENVDLVAVDGSVIIGCALTHSPFVAPSDVNGWLEYWYCEYCGACYSDAQGRYITNRKNCYIPANSISLSDETAEAGADGKIAVNLDSNYGIWALGLEVAFDAEALTLKGIESGIFSADEISYSVNDGVITIFVESAELVDVTETGVAFYLVFEGNVAGTYDIDAELIAENTINAASENVGFAVDGGSIAFTHVCDYEYFEAVEATCHQNGMAAYYYCAECDVVYDVDYRVTNRKNLTIPATAEIIHMDAVEPACHYNGNIEYWYCSDCSAVFADAALTQLTNFKNVIVPALGGEVEHFEAVEATCHQNGNIEYWVCYECEQVWQDAALTQLTNIKNVVTPATAEIIYVEAVEPSCCQNGNSEYWYCSECDAVFADAALTQLTNRKNVMIPATAEIVYVEAVEPSCCQNGSAAYYYCSECDAVYDEDYRLTNRKNLTIPATAEIIYVEAVEPSCCQNGSAAYYYCSECDAVYDEDFRLTNRKNLTIPATAEIIYVEAVEPSCCQNGSAAYYYCSECDAVYDEDFRLTNRKNLTIPATAEIIYVEAVEPSCCQNGSAAYYYCSECDAVYDEDFRLTNRKNLTIPATAEIIYVEAVEPSCCQNGSAAYYYCSECDAVYDEDFRLTNRKNLTIPATAEIIYVEAVEAGCHQYGMAAYYYCSECDSVFDEDFRLTNRKNLVILPENELVYVPYLAPTATENGHYEYWYCPVCDAVFADAAGEQLTNRKNLTIEKTGFIIKASGNDYVASVTLDGATIDVTPRVNAPYVKVSVKYAAGVKIACDAIVSRGPDWAILNIATGESATIVATDAYGNSMEYTVVVDWNNNFYTSVVNGYSTKNTEYVLNGDVINVYAKPGFNNASFGLVLTNGTTYTVSEGLTAVKSGAAIFFKALESAANDTYTITLTTSTGLELVITVNYVFDYQGIDGVLGGYMVDAIEVEDGNVINITTDAANKYASFRFILKNTTSDIEAAEDVEIVMQAGTNIHWMKIFNDGSNYVTTEVYVINANGVRETYTVNVTFGVN